MTKNCNCNNEEYEPYVYILEQIHDAYSRAITFDPERSDNSADPRHYWYDNLEWFSEDEIEDVVDSLYTIVSRYKDGYFENNFTVHLAIVYLYGVCHFSEPEDQPATYRINRQMLRVIDLILKEICSCGCEIIKDLRHTYIAALMSNEDYRRSNGEYYIQGDDLIRMKDISEILFANRCSVLTDEQAKEIREFLERLEEINLTTGYKMNKQYKDKVRELIANKQIFFLNDNQDYQEDYIPDKDSIIISVGSEDGNEFPINEQMALNWFYDNKNKPIWNSVIDLIDLPDVKPIADNTFIIRIPIRIYDNAEISNKHFLCINIYLDVDLYNPDKKHMELQFNRERCHYQTYIGDTFVEHVKTIDAQDVEWLYPELLLEDLLQQQGKTNE